MDKNDKDLDGDDVEGHGDDGDGEDAIFKMAKRLITWKTMVQLGTQLWSKMILMMEMMARLMVIGGEGEDAEEVGHLEDDGTVGNAAVVKDTG